MKFFIFLAMTSVVDFRLNVINNLVSLITSLKRLFCRRRVRFSIGFVPLLFLTGTGSSLLGQEKKQQQTTLQYEVSVTLKLVQVYVTDKQGKPVKDLNKSDFEIFDNGTAKTITEFERHFLTVEVKKPVQVEEPKAAELQKPAVLSGAPLPKLSRKFFFIFDIQQNDLTGFAQSKKAALHFMDTQVQATDEIGILSYQARIGLKMHEYLSRDHKKIRKTIEKLKGVPGTGVDGLPTGADEAEGGGGGGIIASIVPPQNPGDEYLAWLRIDYIQIMIELAKALGYISGYKNIVFFSAGFARSILVGDMIFQKNYEAMAKQFGSSSSPIYTVNSMGARARLTSQDNRGDLSLQNLAALSGGQYFEDVAKVENIETGIQNATGNYYVLGYYVDEKWDGEFHEIKIKVKREGCDVSAQSGYYNPKPFAKFSEFEKQLHLMDLAFSERPQFQSLVELPLVVLPCQSESGTHLVFMTELPWEGLKEILRQKTEAASLIIDEDGNVIESKSGDIEIPDVSGKRIFYYGIFSPKPGAYNYVMILRNMVTGRAVRARGGATIAQPGLSRLKLDPPLLLVPAADKDIAFFRLTIKDDKAVEKSSPALKDLFPFLSNRLAPVMNEIGKETSEALAVVRSTVSNVPHANIEFSASLRPSGGGEEIPLAPSILEAKRQGKTDVLLLELPLPELQPGEYSLTISAKDKNSETIAEVSRAIRII